MLLIFYIHVRPFEQTTTMSKPSALVKLPAIVTVIRDSLDKGIGVGALIELVVGYVGIGKWLIGEWYKQPPPSQPVILRL